MRRPLDPDKCLRAGETPAVPVAVPVPLPISFATWRSCGCLPHFDGGALFQHIVFRLADSLPKHVMVDLKRQSRDMPEEDSLRYLCSEVDHHLDGLHGSCILRNARVAQTVVSALHHFDTERYRLCAYCVMPNHVHALVEQISGWTLQSIIHSWKSWTSHELVHLGFRLTQTTTGTDTGITTGTAGVSPARRQRPSNTIWYREYFDRYIRHQAHYEQTIHYIHHNPVKAWLVSKPEDWPWSSAGNELHPML